MTQEQTHRAIVADFNALGVQLGDVVLMHSSFKSLGPVPGGIETLITALEEVVGTTGTLLMPALSYLQEPHCRHDTRHTPSCVGAISEYFRLRPGTRRSLHPTHSVCAIGCHADRLLADHALDSTPCGPHSPLRKMIELNAKIILLGCGLRPNTTMHALEEFVEPPYLFSDDIAYEITDGDGHTYTKSYRGHRFAGWAQRYDRIAELPVTSFMRRGHVLAAETHILETPGLKEAVLKQLRVDPFFFVERVDSQ
jgi:aminoglycoside 3-N-acetyltransferase